MGDAGSRSPDNGSADSSNVYESDDSSWGESGNHKSNDQINTCPHKSARVRRDFDPSHMPSGTLEMENLRRQIDKKPGDR